MNTCYGVVGVARRAWQTHVCRQPHPSIKSLQTHSKCYCADSATTVDSMGVGAGDSMGVPCRCWGQQGIPWV